MPVSRRRKIPRKKKRGGRARIMTVEDLTPGQYLSFAAAWAPPTFEHGQKGFDRHRDEFGPWRDWRSYLAAWESIRAEFIEQHGEPTERGGRRLFAERVRSLVQELGIEAVEATVSPFEGACAFERLLESFESGDLDDDPDDEDPDDDEDPGDEDHGE